MDENKKSRIRAPNFSKEEQALLFRIMEDYANIFENKKTDQIRQCDKTAAWREISELFNANTTEIPRTTENLIACYRNVKSKIKKDHSEAKKLSIEKQATIVNAFEENGTDWPKFALNLSSEPEVCIEPYKQRDKEHRRDDDQQKRSLIGTGNEKKRSKTFKQLAEARLELVQLQKKSAEIDIEIKKNQLKEIIEQNEFNAIMRKKELAQLSTSTR